MTTPDSLSLFRPLAIARASTPSTRVGVQKLATVFGRLRLWRDRYNGRRTIQAMTSEQIADLDLDPLALRREGEKPFWRA